MWDPEQLEAIAVCIDGLQAAGDPLGEWLAIRERIETGDLAQAERKILRQRARQLRTSLGSRLVLAQDPALAQPHVVRERGWISELGLDAAAPAVLERILARPDASFVLGLRLRGPAAPLEACLELLRASPVRLSLRRLVLDRGPEGREPFALAQRIAARADALGRELSALFELEVEGQLVGLRPAPVGLADPAWSAARRTALGRTLASPDPLRRREALHQLRAHGAEVAQLRTLLLRLIEHDPERRVRAAAFALVPQLGAMSEAMFAVLLDSARRRKDALLLDWLTRIGRS